MSLSFRDPAGTVFAHGGRVLRLVHEAGRPDLEAFLSTRTYRTFSDEGRLARTSLLDDAEAGQLLEDVGLEGARGAASLVVEHERVPFRSFPYEWPPEMLYEAASLTLDLAESALGEGFGLKDATPYNVLFRGPRAVFVDLLSFERRAEADPVWLPYAQFVSTFLLPLLAHRHFALPLDQVFLARREGLRPEDLYAMCGPAQRLRPPFLTLVSLPVLLASRQNPDDPAPYTRKTLDDPEKARFILRHLFKRLRRLLSRVRPHGRPDSAWSRYTRESAHLSAGYVRDKDAFVAEVFAAERPQSVLDVGCNTGRFSLAAARAGASVVGLDGDAASVGELWRAARDEGLDVLPLVLDITRPSPSVGWRNAECPSFLERAEGSFDALLMLAVVHHLLVGELVPLAEIFELCARLTTRLLVVEFVPPDDPMFRRLVRGRGALFEHLTRDFFEQTSASSFRILRSADAGDTGRRLYLMQKKT